jgi:NAD+ kinase
MTDRRQDTIGVVVHPRRGIDVALDAVRAWAESRGAAMGQVAVEGQDRRVAELVEPERCSVIAALGGDGTVLGALHRAASARVPVLGVACGSLGALTSVKAPDVAAALDRFEAGDYAPRRLPALDVTRDGEPIGEAFNDLSVMRHGAGQVVVGIDIDGAPYAGLAGDGVVIATPLGSSGYTIAAGGPLIAAAADALVVTGLAPHGGSIPPVVLAARSTVRLEVDGGWSGARVEQDGRVIGTDKPSGEQPPFVLEVVMRPRAALLVDLDDETLIAGLRRRGVIADSPRLAVRAARRPGDR